MSYARRTDTNQAAIVAALRGIGAFVEPTLAKLGHGVPDLLVGFRGVWYLAEVKDDAKPPSARTLTPDEQDWHRRASTSAPVYVIENVTEAMKMIGLD
jgi:hypothetical protein